MWVPLIENDEYQHHGADFFIKKNLHNLFAKGTNIDVVLLACTHYPLLKEKIQEHLPVGVKLVSQGEIVANSLRRYLDNHPEMAAACSRGGTRLFYTTDSVEDFDSHATRFFGEPVGSQPVSM